VVVQDGDYFGRTVNLAARIADYSDRVPPLVDARDRLHQRLQLQVVVGRAGAPTGDRVGRR
jgi:class 3 adenylate cyclase